MSVWSNYEISQYHLGLGRVLLYLQRLRPVEVYFQKLFPGFHYSVLTGDDKIALVHKCLVLFPRFNWCGY